jgi:hypothetical protein
MQFKPATTATSTTAIRNGRFTSTPAVPIAQRCDDSPTSNRRRLDQTDLGQYFVELLLDFWRCRHHWMLVGFQHA